MHAASLSLMYLSQSLLVLIVVHPLLLSPLVEIGHVLFRAAPVHKSRWPLGSRHKAHDCEKVGHGRRDLFRPRKSSCLPELLRQRNDELTLVASRVLHQVIGEISQWLKLFWFWLFVDGGIHAVKCKVASMRQLSKGVGLVMIVPPDRHRIGKNTGTGMRLGDPACARMRIYRKS